MLTDKEQEEIRRKMQELDAEPPAMGWRKIDAELRPRRRWRWLFWLLPAVVSVGVGSAVLLLVEPTATDGPQGNKLTNRPLEALSNPKQPETTTQAALSKAPKETSVSINKPVPLANPKAGKASLKPAKNLGSSPAGNRQIKTSKSSFKQLSISKERILLTKRIARSEPTKKSPETETTNSQNRLANETPAQSLGYLYGKGITPSYIQAKSPQLHFSPLPLAEPNEIIPVKQRQKTPPEWTVGVFFTPRYAFRKFIPSVSDEILITRLNNKNQSNTQRLGYELGIEVSKAIAPNVYIESAIAWMQLQENVSYAYATDKIDTVIRTVSGNNQLQVTPVYQTNERMLVSSYAYGNWRLGASYYFWQNARRRFSVTLSGGVNLLVKGKTHQYINGVLDETVVFPSRNNLLEQTNYNLSFGLGYNIASGRAYELKVMPTFNYFLGSTFQSREPFGLKPYSLGIHLQIKRRFVKARS